MYRLITLTLLILFPTASYAQESINTQYGIAMHGEPKYGIEDTHLDYVNPDTPKGGTIKIASIGSFDTLNPYSIKGTAAEGLNLVYDRLMRRVWDEPFTMYPLVAERIEVPEDRSSITVHINPAARFHDGSAITADDVTFSFETLKESGRPNMRQIYKLVKTVEKRGEQSVYFEFGEGFDQETVMILTLMPILSKSYWEDRTFDQTTLETPLLNGPYKIKDFEPGRYITYERVKDYWAKDLMPHVGHYNFDEITYEYYRDDTVALEAFLSGALDIRREWNATKWNTAYDENALKANNIVKQALPHGRPERTRGFIFNTRRAPFDDVNVRKALDMAFDFEWVNTNLLHGQYRRIDSYFPNSELSADITDNEKRSIRERLRSAGSLLDESGWTIKDGKRVNQSGETFAFELIVADQEQQKIALNLQRSLKRLGIDMHVRILDSAEFQNRLLAYDYDMVAHHWQSSLSPGTEQMLYWGCEAAKQQGRFNYAGICDPEIDTLAKSVANVKSRKALVETMKALDQKLLDGQYMIPLYYIGKDFVAYNDQIQHPEITPLYGMVMESWWNGALNRAGDNPSKPQE